MSEKAWQALHLGAVPIYFGAPNAANILPHGSFINMLKYVTADGSFDLALGNMSAGSLGEAVVINFAVIKSAAD